MARPVSEDHAFFHLLMRRTKYRRSCILLVRVLNCSLKSPRCLPNPGMEGLEMPAGTGVTKNHFRRDPFGVSWICIRARDNASSHISLVSR